MMVQLLGEVIEQENWTEEKGLIICGAKNTFFSGSDLKAVKALGTPEDGVALFMFIQNPLTRFIETYFKKSCSESRSGTGWRCRIYYST